MKKQYVSSGRVITVVCENSKEERKPFIIFEDVGGNKSHIFCSKCSSLNGSFLISTKDKNTIISPKFGVYIKYSINSKTGKLNLVNIMQNPKKIDNE